MKVAQYSLGDLFKVVHNFPGVSGSFFFWHVAHYFIDNRIKTPDNIRKLGGALFCDRRYDTVFVYHNGADSYYSVRGFRGSILI
ncbi:MAG: DUF4256 domain-containing protein [Dethiobacter sp.]|nr:DUF4256 domain-containing protein [Dethiobacter sp.]MBS3982279.1 DUF4256 domain-containing protein [Dethiobacter sp.]